MSRRSPSPPPPPAELAEPAKPAEPEPAKLAEPAEPAELHGMTSSTTPSRTRARSTAGPSRPRRITQLQND